MAIIVGACLFSITYQQGTRVRSSAEARESLGSGAMAEKKAEDIQLVSWPAQRAFGPRNLPAFLNCDSL